jgi:hypothetical protein
MLQGAALWDRWSQWCISNKNSMQCPAFNLFWGGHQILAEELEFGCREWQGHGGFCTTIGAEGAFQIGRLQGTKWWTRVAVTRRFGVRAFSSLVALLCPGPAWSCVSKLATSLLLMRLDIPVLPQSSVCGRFVSADRLFLSIKHPYTCPRSASRRRTDFTEA